MRVTIEKLVFGGNGLARTSDGVVLVPGVIPGEECEIQPEGKINGCMFARVSRIVNQSPSRIAPSCPHAEQCGGCDWSHINYSAQLVYKKEIWSECMTRTGKLKLLPEPQIYSGPREAYRLRCQFKTDGKRVGFYREGTNELVEPQNCPILVGSLNSLLQKLRHVSELNTVGVKSIRAIAGDTGVASSPVFENFTKNETELTVAGKKFKLSGDSFFQGNTHLLQQLGTWGEKAGLSGSICVDVYGGCGFFSVLLAHRFTKGLLIESIGTQVEAARNNFKLNNIAHFSAKQGNAEDVSAICAGMKGKIDLIIIDPPRAGLSKKARESITRLNPSKILYVSCNPSTQARDAQYFTEQKSYSIQSSALFDLYPDTHHMESVLLFEKE